MKELSPAAPRALLHTRQVQCTGWEREDGLFDIEGRLSDGREQNHDATGGKATRKAGEPYHLMTLRITLDATFTIVAARAVSHEAPYSECCNINGAYGQLAGMQIKAGFNRAVKSLFSGEQGCTHLTELLGPMATTAFQALGPVLARRRAARGEVVDDSNSLKRLMGSCFGLRQGGEAAIIRWGDRAAK